MLNFIRKCIVSLISKDDTKHVRVQQISYNEGARDAEVYAPYGMSYNIPAGSVCLYAQVGGDPGNLVIFPDRSQDRVKDLAEGEVAFFNPMTQTRTIYRKDGSMEIVINGKLIQTIGGDATITITGKCNVTVSGDANLKAANFNVDAAKSNIGVGGNNIGRVGDAVEVYVLSGSSAGTWQGVIKTGGINTSI